MWAHWGTLNTDIRWCDNNHSGTISDSVFPVLWLDYLFSPHDALLRNGVLNSPRELTWPTLWSGWCKQHRVGFFFFGHSGQNKHLTIGPALLPCLSLLWAEDSVSGRVCYVHKCPISSWTAVNLETVAVQRCSHEISRPVCPKVEAQKTIFQNHSLYCEAAN